jgi:hypothetical protein
METLSQNLVSMYKLAILCIVETPEEFNRKTVVEHLGVFFLKSNKESNCLALA